MKPRNCSEFRTSTISLGRTSARSNPSERKQEDVRTIRHPILFLAANSEGTDRLALDREARAIQHELERGGCRDSFDLVARWAVEPLDLLRELRKVKPTVVQFSGHGRRPRCDALKVEPRCGNLTATCPAVLDGALYFQGPDGRPQLVSPSALVETVAAVGMSVRVVVLSACFSDVYAAQLLAHVDCVVGIAASIGDDAARAFAIGFYGGLGDGESVAAAFQQGRAAILLAGLPDWGCPQLRVRAGCDANRAVLASPARGSPRYERRHRGRC